MSTAASTIRHALGAGLEALLLLAIIAALIFGTATLGGLRPAGADSVFAAKGDNGGGRLTATISFAGGYSATNVVIPAGSDVSFAVTRSVADNDSVLWVTNTCFDGSGAVLSKVDLPVAWGMWYSLEGTAGPFSVAGTHCTAIATLKPWLGKALGDAILGYDVL